MSMPKPIAFIHEIQSIPTPYQMQQAESISWIMRALQRSEGGPEQAKALNLYERMLSNENIVSRGSVLSDYKHSSWDEMSLFKESVRSDASVSPWFAPPLQDRMKIYVDAADTMARKAFAETSQAPKYIVDISCTGYRAPYTAQMLVLEKCWEKQTRLLKIGHMGCYASVPGIHMGAQLASSLGADEIVSVLSTELCTLHLDPLATDADQVVSNILFADGCAKMNVASNPKPNSLALIAHYEALVPNSTQYMAWDLQDSRFHMTLSRKVVTQLNAVIGQHLSEFLEANDVSKSQITRYAIHPGGPRIVESIQEALNLDDDAVRHSKAILKKHGNMSSATLPHVWKAMQEDISVKSGELIVSMAFGPGLTVTMNLLQKV
ncbi:MAG: hypothetical protein EOP04_06415 [Proteobacteria bacterium]|nr:MAG: hypothetical protein EOP04_06415 [Pseudomonadota bacterium]